MKRIFVVLIALVIGISPVFSQKREPGKVKTVVIDPGHGGDKPGALGKKSSEKDIVLSVALKFGKLISDNYPDVDIIYTRTTDIDITLAERAHIANRNKADLFISVHANSCPSSSPTGVETFVMGLSQSKSNMDVAKKENADILLEAGYKNNAEYQGFDPNSPESYVMFAMYQNAYLDKSLNFAKYVQDQYKIQLRTIDRGVKQAEFFVLYKTAMPSVLTEIGFISNPDEEAYMMSDEGQANIAISLFNAFATYKATEEGTPKLDKPKIDLPGYGDKKTTAKKPEKQLAENTTKPKPEAKPATETPKAEPKPAAETPKDEAKPAAENQQTEAKPTRVVMSRWIETAEAAPQPETKPTTEIPDPEPKPAAETPKSETPKTAAETPKTAAETPKTAAETPKSETPKTAAETPKSETAKPAAETPKTETPKTAAETPKTETPKPAAETPKTETPKPAAETPKPQAKPESKPAVDPAEQQQQILDKALYAAIAAARGDEVPVVERPVEPERPATTKTTENDGASNSQQPQPTTPKFNPNYKPANTTNPTATTTPTASQAAASSQNRVIFKVQFLRTDRELRQGDSELRGVTGFEMYRSNGAYCYTMGSFKSTAEAKPKQNELRKLGFSDAFVVAFYRGQRISMQQAHDMGY